jgi:hypothetical protein
MTAETATKQDAEIRLHEKTKQPEKKVQTSIQELVASLRNVADDIGQTVELSSEEKLLVAEFFATLLKLMRPLAPAMSVSTTALPEDVGPVVQAYIDPTGHLALIYEYGHLELKDLGEEKYRDLMIAVVEDVLPKFQNLTSAQKRKVENRLNFMSTVTKELQKISEAISLLTPADQK